MAHFSLKITLEQTFLESVRLCVPERVPCASVEVGHVRVGTVTPQVQQGTPAGTVRLWVCTWISNNTPIWTE